MFRNVIFPLTILLLTTVLVIYFSYLKVGWVCWLLISFLPLFFLQDTFYYFFCNLFPDDRNLNIRPTQKVFKQSNKLYADKPTKTKADKATLITTLSFWVLIFFIWHYLSVWYVEFHLNNYGIKTIGIVTKAEDVKEPTGRGAIPYRFPYYGEIREYEYVDESGKKYSDFILNDKLKVGDTISITYSSNRPVINFPFGQTILYRAKAEASVTKFMRANNKNYTPISFGEFFGQYYSKDLQEIAKTNKVIKYSLVHTFSIDNIKTTNMYFHLDEMYNVIGKNTDEEMTKLVDTQLRKNSKFDSILKSIEKEIPMADTVK